MEEPLFLSADKEIPATQPYANANRGINLSGIVN